MTGIIKKWEPNKKFGFIRADGAGADFFFHLSECVLPLAEITTGRRVEFDETETSRGLRAVNVRAIA